MSDPLIQPFELFAPLKNKTALTAQKVFRAVPEGQVSVLRDGHIQPLCHLTEFRQAYTYLFGLLALWAMEQDPKDSLWSCNTEYSYNDYRLQFSPRDVQDALGHPGCALLGLLAMDGWARAVHGEIFKQGSRAYLSSAFQRMGEFCFATDLNPLCSLSKNSKPELARMLDKALDYVKTTHGLAVWREDYLRKVTDAMRNSGHFIYTIA